MMNALPTAPPAYGLEGPSAGRTVDNATPQGSTYLRGNSVQSNGAGSSTALTNIMNTFKFVTNKVVYFHIDELARDSITASGLKKILATRGITLVYGNRYLTPKVIKYFGKAFDAIILPKPMFLEGYGNIDNIKLPPIITLHTEAVGAAACNQKLSLVNIFGRPFMEGDKRYADRIFAFCVWGEIHKQQVVDNFPSYANKCYVVGHPRHDKNCLGMRNSTANVVKNNKKKIGLITRNVLLNPFDGRHVFKFLFAYMNGESKYYYNNKFTGDKLEIFDSDRSVEDFFYTQTIDARILVEILNSIDYKKYDVSLRVHPREDRTTYEKLVKSYDYPVEFPDWRMPYLHWVAGLDYVVGPSSTSFYDVLVAGKTPICTDNICSSRKNHTVSGRADTDELLNYIVHPESIDALMSLLDTNQRLNCIPDGAKIILRRETNYPESMHSLQAIADVCQNAVTSKCTSCVVKYASLVLFFFYKTVSSASIYMYINIFRRIRDQGSTFIMTRRVTRFIDSLVKI